MTHASDRTATVTGFCTVYQILIKSKRMRWEGDVARMIQMRNALKILVGKPERKRLLLEI
jgi:hypothetical protein